MGGTEHLTIHQAVAVPRERFTERLGMIMRTALLLPLLLLALPALLFLAWMDAGLLVDTQDADDWDL
jgi:hypothetical protein